MCRTVMIILLKQRSASAVKVQELLTEYGCSIRTRLGLHEVEENSCSDEGLIILQLCGSDEHVQELEQKLNALEGVKAKTVFMSFED
jgi:hypothetical protein